MSAIHGITAEETAQLAASIAPAGSVVDAPTASAMYARAAWSCVVEPGDGVAGLLVGAIGPTRALSLLVERAPARRFAEEIAASTGEPELQDQLRRRIDEGIKRWTPRLERTAVDRAIGLAARIGMTLVTPDDDAWPIGLDDLGPHAPIALWMRGQRAALAGFSRSFALVGARAASPYGRDQTVEAASGLVERGFTIVSGAAYGIDAAAHDAALRTGGTTIAFLAGGADRPYPAGHHELLDRVMLQGAVLSEVPCGTAPTRWRFLQRNRLIAASSLATVVVEAGWRSGSLNTAGHAAAVGRPLGALPGRVDSPASSGCHRLIRDYGAVCVTGPAEMAELVDGPAHVTWRAAAERSPDEVRVIDALSSRSPRAPLDIARRAGLTVSVVEGVLALLELESIAVDRGGGSWVYRAPVS